MGIAVILPMVIHYLKDNTKATITNTIQLTKLESKIEYLHERFDKIIRVVEDVSVLHSKARENEIRVDELRRNIERIQQENQPGQK